jgi:hypothetical protein
MVLSDTEAIYVSKVELTLYSVNITNLEKTSFQNNNSQDLGLINGAFHGYGFKMQV